MGAVGGQDNSSGDYLIVDPEASTHLVGGIPKRNRKRARAAKMRVRVATPDPSLTGNAGMAEVSELCDRLDGDAESAGRPDQAA
jgi:hypothetical protein